MKIGQSEKKTKAYETVSELLLQQITQGIFQPGDRLPSERALCDAYNVSRPTIREAIRYLESIGCVETKTGAGSYVKSPSLEEFAAPFSIAFSVDNVVNRDLLEVRSMLDIEIITLAAMRRTSEQLKQLKQNLERMKADIATGGDGTVWDEEFHRLLGQSTNNKIISSLMDMCSSIYSYTIRLSHGIEGMPDTAVYQHEGLIEAIENHDVKRAQLLTKQHLLRTQYRSKQSEAL